MMKKYIITGKTSQDFATAMLNKPQNRKSFVEPFLESLAIDMSEFLFTSGIDRNFVAVVSAEAEEQVETLCNIVFASGNFSNLAWSRAFEAEEYQEVFQKGHEKMEKYISAVQVAGKE
jgi:GYD domain.